LEATVKTPQVEVEEQGYPTDDGKIATPLLDGRVVSAIGRADRVDRTSATGISFDTVRGLVARTVVEEGVEVWSVRVPAVSSTENGIFVHGVAETDTRADVLVVLRVERV
jgi:hypothetical protein